MTPAEKRDRRKSRAAAVAATGTAISLPSTDSSMRQPRRTQQQRRTETRAKLLDATIQSLQDDGYAMTTTRRVAEIAGVSQGAQSHHFPRRVDLVGAAIEELAERRLGELHAAAEHLPVDPHERVRALLDLIWSDFSGPVFTVFVKLWVAAAHDQELYARLIPIERKLARAIAEEARNMSGEALLKSDGWEARMLVILSTLRGLALSHAFEPRNRKARDLWPVVRGELEQMLIRQQ